MAAYSPRNSVTVDPPTTGAAPRVVTTTTFNAGDSATRSARLFFPRETNLPPGTVTTTACAPADELAARCPESSRIGRVTATSPLGTASGSLNFTGLRGNKIRAVLFLRVGTTLVGRGEALTEITPSGIVTDLTSLPNQRATRFSLELDGPPKALIANPTRCGTHTFRTELTSYANERATVSSSVRIGGCPVFAPLITQAEFVGTGLGFDLNQRAGVRVTAQRRGGAAKTVSTFRGRRGRNRVRNLAHKLGPGRYLLVIRARNAAGKVARKRLRLRVLQPRLAASGASVVATGGPGASASARTETSGIVQRFDAGVRRGRNRGASLRLTASVARTNGAKLPASRTLELRTPRGFGLRLRSFPACPIAFLQSDQEELCPPGSQVGRGSARLDGRPLILARVPTSVRVYNGQLASGRRVLLMYSRATLGSPVPLVGRLGRARRPYGTRVVTSVDLPPFPVPGRPGFTVERFDFRVGATTRRRGRRVPFVTRPRSCPTRTWSFLSKLGFASGPSISTTDRVRCKR
jgi:hypothetical protein